MLKPSWQHGRCGQVSFQRGDAIRAPSHESLKLPENLQNLYLNRKNILGNVDICG